MVDEKEFNDLFDLNPFSVSKKSLAPTHPPVDLRGQTHDITQTDYSVHYGKFFVNETGNAELEQIMESCLRGEQILCWERAGETKDGEIYITIKYLTPKEKTQKEGGVIKGRRRQRKANL